MKNRLVKLLSACLIVCGCISSILATEIQEVEEHAHEHIIESRARLCSCGGSMVVTSTTYGAWLENGEIDCKHHTFGTDLTYRRMVMKDNTCSSCGKTVTSTSYETKIECHGYEAN